MGLEKRIVALSIAAGLALGLLDAVLDWWVFYEGTFWDLVVARVPAHEIFFRSTVLLTFTIFGIIVSRSVSKRRRTEDALHRSQQRQKDVSALLEGARAVLRRREFQHVARSIFDSCKRLVGASGGYVALSNAEGTENEVLFLDSGGLSCTVDPSLPMPIRGLREKVHRSGEAACDNDFSRSEWAGFLPEGHVGLDNVLFAPLTLEGRVVGLLGIANKPGGFTDHDANLASAFGELAAIALQNSRVLKSLEESEQRFRQLAENIGDVFWLYDVREHRAVYVSPAYDAVFGTSRDCVYEDSANWMENVHPEDRQRVAATFAKQRQGSGHDFEEEYRVVHPDGPIRWIHDRGFPVPDAQGQVYRVAGIAKDITERRQAEEALRASKNALAIRNRIAGAFLTVEDDDMYVEVLNVILDAFDSQYGYFGYIDEQGNLACPTMTTEIWERCEVSEKSIVFPREKWGGLWGQSLLENRALFCNGPLRTPKGHLPLGRVLLAPIMHRGRLIGQFAVADRRSQYGERDKDLLVAIAEYVAPVLHARLEKERSEKDRRKAEEALQKAHHELERRVEERTAELAEVNERLRREMEERERVEKALRRAERLASIGTLATGIAHEINNPLHAIALSAEVAIQAKDQGGHGQTQDKVLRTIQGEVFRCGRIVKSVLQFARQEVSDRWPCRLGDVVRRCRDLVRQQATDAEISVQLELDDDLPPLTINPTEMEQVFVNLISNAIEASKPGGYVSIRSETSSDSVRVLVEDQGRGMGKEQLAHVFDPFFTTHQAAGGTGLGLSITHGIIQQHGGTIDVESRPGQGTAFAVTLPLRPRTAQGDEDDEGLDR